MMREELGAASVVVVIPAYRPNGLLPIYVGELFEAGIARIVVVDDGSGPDYRAVFDRVRAMEGCDVLSIPENRGKGAALKMAFSHLLAQAEQQKTTVPAVVTADSDGQHAVKDVLAVCGALAQHPDTLVLGCRDFNADTPWRSALGNRVISAAMGALYGIALKDTQTGLRGIPGCYLRQVGALPGNRYEYELNMLIWARQHTVAFTVVPVETIYFENNAGSHYRPVLDSLRIAMRLLAGVLQYSAAAVLSAFVDVFAYWILVKLVFHALPLGGRVLAAAAVARAASSALNYACNRRLPMAQNREVRGTIWKYYCLWAMQLTASVGLTWALCQWTGMDEMLAKLLVDLLLALMSYQVQLHWVFAAPGGALRQKEQALPAWNWFGRLVRWVLRVAMGRWQCKVPAVQEPRVYVVHHHNLRGPIWADAFLNEEAHVMVLSVFTHRKSCFDQYYRYTFTRRFGWPRPLAFITAGALGLIIPSLMRGVGAVPVQRGVHDVFSTLSRSVNILMAGKSLIVCPDMNYADDSAVMGDSYQGYLLLEKYYFAKTGRHVAFVPLHCSPASKALVAGEAVYCVDEDGKPAVRAKNRQEASDCLRASLNCLAVQCGDLSENCAYNCPDGMAQEQEDPASATG